MNITDEFSAEDRRFWSFYAQHMLKLVERAEKNGVPLWKSAKAPREAAEYATRAVTEIRKCLDAKSPYFRRRALQRAATRFHKCRGWRGEIPDLAKSFGNALHALAADQVPGKAGNPARTIGSSGIPERRYVNRAVDELTVLAISKSRPDWVAELLKPGSKNKASQGRKLVFRYALKLTKKDGETLSEKRLREQIRERAKAAPVHINSLALYARKLARKKQRKRRLIKAPGT
jgi:hypothetical protein